MLLIDSFVGRHKEIERFESLLDNHGEKNGGGKPHIAFIYSATQDEKGGIGKTKLLYKFLEIAKSPKYYDKFLVIDEIIDFYEPVNRDRMSRIFRFVQILEDKTGSKAFHNFGESVSGYYKKTVSAEKVIQDYEQAFKELCDTINKKILYFFDTFEAVETTLNYYQKPYRFITDEIQKNSLVVISGRNKPDFNTPLWEGREVEEFPLRGFTFDEAREFFALGRNNKLTDKNIKRINTKTRGRPILLALVIDYLNTILDVKDIIDLPTERFTEDLVNFIGRFENPPIHQAIVAMAHIKYRCNDTLLEMFMGQAQNVEEYYKILKSLSFVRDVGSNYVVLHDEMQKMVYEFYIKKNDPTGDMRNDISRKAIKYYNIEISKLKDQENHFKVNGDSAKEQVIRDAKLMTRAEQWFHKLYRNKAKTIDTYFYGMYDKFFEESQLDFCFVLQKHLEDLCNYLNLSGETVNRIKLRKAKLYTEKYQFTSNNFYYDHAESVFRELIRYAGKISSKRFLGCLWYELAILKFYQRELLRAERYLKKSVKILAEEASIKEAHQDIYYFQGIANNWLGYVFYNQGKFQESILKLETAEHYLKNATDSLKNKQHKKLRLRQIEKWIAQVHGNLCRIYREIGETQKSIDYGKSSLKLRRKLGNPKDIIKGLNSLGLVYARSETSKDRAKARKLYHEAELHLRNVPDPILQGRISTNQATLIFKRDFFSDLLSWHSKDKIVTMIENFNIKDHEINEARNLLSGVIQKLFKTNSRELSTAYHNLGELYLMVSDFDKALHNFEEASRVAALNDDNYTLLNSFQRQVLTAYWANNPALFNRKYKRFLKLIEDKKGVSEVTIRYVIRFFITAGNYNFDKLATVNKNRYNRFFVEGCQAFASAINYGHKHSQDSAKRTEQIFSERLREVFKTRESITSNLRNQLGDIWKKEELDLQKLESILDFKK